MKITRIRIGLLSTEKLRFQKRLDHPLGSDEAPTTPLDDAHHYWAEAIEDGDKFYYRVNDTTVEITRYEFSKVVINPWLHYFSTALKLHKRIERAKIARSLNPHQITEAQKLAREWKPKK
jgi:pullulanase/glycogen debranching enzyme